MQYPSLLTTLLTTLTLLTPSLVTAIPTASPDSNIQSAPSNATTAIDIHKAVPFPFSEKNPEPLTHVLDAILHIPDDVIDNDDEGISLHQYILEHGGAGLTLDLSAVKSENGLSERQGWFEIAKCAFEIGKVILENLVPLAKLRRIKDLIASIGNASKVAKMMLKAKSWAELKAVGGPAMVRLAEELSGLSGVVGACFSF